MSCNVYIARTPLQLFNCIEARERFHLGTKNYLFCVYRKKVDRQLMETLLDGEWTAVYYVGLNILTQQSYPFRINKILKGLGHVENCYLGLPKHLGAHIVNSVQPNKVLFVDDGNEILKISSAIASGWYRRFYFVPWRKQIFGMRVSLEYCDRSLFFTMYDLERYFSEDRIIRNDYRCFRQRIEQMEFTDEVFFIGSNILGQYITDQQIFKKYLEKVRHYYGSRRFCYAPHRYEDLEWLSQVGRELDFEIVPGETILEYRFYKCKKIPREIATFRSTALDTLAMLYKTSSLVFPIDPRDLNTEAHRQEFAALYADYQSRDIPIATYLK